MSLRYQRGSLRREKRAGQGDVWIWRYRLNGTMKQEKYPVADFMQDEVGYVAAS
jgi:hypothetical protein